jgi:YesN/AraC family two-component response regulator
MIILNDCKLEFSSIGLFDTDNEWTHPKIAVKTYELIFIINGEVYIAEDKTEYHLKRGDLLLLDKDVEHYGTNTSFGHTSFYWLHFHCNDINKLFKKKVYNIDHLSTERIMKELSHLFASKKELAELALMKFILEIESFNDYKNPYAYEIAEFIRINRNKPLTVNEISKRFGYNPDYISRIIKKEFGVDAKSLIIKQRLEFVQSLLINTDYSLKEITESAGFENQNYFIKFFKYHAGTTPSKFRKKYFLLHMNNI